MGLTVGIWIALIPVALVVLLTWSAWKLARPTQLRQELNAQLKAVLAVHSAIAMHNQELSAALRAERAYVQQLQRQLELCQRG
ncbi:hypothetical protein R4K19_24250 [Pseudomonas aeruginosa]|uniref:hypothetical protein n=1 Tax=Pseudomonas aeruginosa TaxID=287 RepID=UPI000FF7B1FC|nr:hypothetical protein [Pseudomonas aeruginosa]MCT5252117.1 hypothetical protein [Pseudomonas aeruginosa]MDV8134127.1 hypothetical protein [Pseudomonas aeruginosa]RPX28712.1 hypothetical protein IPC720_31175 [Pseudomonas aeruginosa]HCF5960141.1 hypothetical protein [Pseudomonas aeruginosa]HCF5986786.1 hypothetical protein [Pseudomonas aeruginosa]